MTVTKSGRLWIAYGLVFYGGWALLAYSLRRPHIEWFVYWLPFAFPVVLCAIGARAANYQADEQPPPVRVSTSITGRPIERISPRPPRPTYPMTQTMLLSPVCTWIFPPFTGVPNIQYVFYAWWFGCAAFVIFVLPRLSVPDSASAKRASA